MNCITNRFWICLFLLTIVFPGVGHAITIDVPQTVSAGQPATIVITGVPIVDTDAGCYLNISYGDGRGSVDTNVVECAVTAGTPCSATVTHTYQNPGTYTLNAYSSGCAAAAQVFSPDPALKAISVVDFSIQRMELYFKNQQPKITVKQYQRNLNAAVDIRYTGSGMLQGRWEIDGRLFAEVRKQLPRGQQKVTIQTPVAPPLPTHAVGTHRVRFVITQPTVAIAFPQALYFVEAEKAESKLAINLTAPMDRKTVVCEPMTFRWQTSGKAYVYLVEFIEDDSETPTFSAYAKDATYALREAVCRSLFSAGRTYRWRVKGLSQEGQIIGESDSRYLYLTPGE